MSMIPVRVGGLAIDERTKSPVVLLQEIEGNRVLRAADRLGRRGP